MTSGPSQVATFDENDHAVTAGWATYQQKPMRRFRLRCAVGHHVWPIHAPERPNGFSPSNYDRCDRCDASMHWYVEGQHRFGSYDRDRPPVVPQPTRRAGVSRD